MEEIKVGEYVRLRGEILKIEIITNKTEDDCYIKFKEYASGNTFNYLEIKEWKHSPNIIDLIEERRLCEWLACCKARTCWNFIYNLCVYRWKRFYNI